MSVAFEIAGIPVGPGHPLLLIAGPCVIESREHALHMARALQEVAREAGLPLVYKSSFDKANRSRLTSYRGPGLRRGLEILAEVRELGLPVLTDVHLPEQAAPVAEVADVLQVPAFLCRQTDLLLAAGRTGRAVNVKKGQFLAPWDLRWAVEKVRSTGNQRVLVTERGTAFGYGDLVVDPRSLLWLRETGCPVVFDATHSVQRRAGEGAGEGGETGGLRGMVAPLARAAVAVGVDALFLEVHDRPERALSDRGSQYPLRELPALLRQLVALRRALEEP